MPQSEKQGTMKKYVILAILAIAFLIMPSIVPSVDGDSPVIHGSIGDNITWTMDVGADTLTLSGTGKMIDGVVFLPMLYGVTHLIVGEGITSIGANAFNSTGGAKLAYLNFPSTLERIGKNAFRGSTARSVDIPANVTFIHPEAFSNTRSLASINVHGDNQTYCTYQGVMFTKDMMEISMYPAGKAGRAYQIPGGVRSIGEYAFYGAQLYDLIIPSSVEYVSNWAIYGCESMLSLDIPDSVVHMGYGSVAFCSKISRITLGAGITEVTVDMIPDLLASVKILHLGKNVSKVDKEISRGLALNTITVDSGNQYFTSVGGVLYNKGVTEVILIPGAMTGKYIMPNTVRYIGSNVFQFTSVSSVVLSESLQAIGSQAFYKNSGIASIKIPKTVKTVGDRAFANCSTLVMVYFEGNNPPSVGNDAFNTNSLKNPELRIYSSMAPGFLDNYAGSTAIAYHDSETVTTDFEDVASNPIYIVAIAISAMLGLVLTEIIISRKQRQ